MCKVGKLSLGAKRKVSFAPCERDFSRQGLAEFDHNSGLIVLNVSAAARFISGWGRISALTQPA